GGEEDGHQDGGEEHPPPCFLNTCADRARCEAWTGVETEAGCFADVLPTVGMRLQAVRRARFVSALGESGTCTCYVLSAVPLPVGLRGRDTREPPGAEVPRGRPHAAASSTAAPVDRGNHWIPPRGRARADRIARWPSRVAPEFCSPLSSAAGSSRAAARLRPLRQPAARPRRRTHWRYRLPRRRRARARLRRPHRRPRSPPSRRPPGRPSRLAIPTATPRSQPTPGRSTPRTRTASSAAVRLRVAPRQRLSRQSRPAVSSPSPVGPTRS